MLTSKNLTFVNYLTKICCFLIKAMLGLLQKHCPVCGMDVDKNTEIKRFGKYFCSEDDAKQYAEMKMAGDVERSSDRGFGRCC
jgi:hypothetical protein